MIRLKYARGANAVTMIKRSEFGTDKYVPMIFDKVRVSIRFKRLEINGV